MQSSYLAERKQLEALYKRRKLDIVYSQQPIQPLQPNYDPGNQINLVFQNSKHMLDLSKVQLFFRPIIRTNYTGVAAQEVAYLAMMGVTPIAAEVFFSVQSITINGNQILANPQTSLQRTRNIWQSYYNNMTSYDSKKLLHGDESSAAVLFSGLNVGTQAGFEQASLTHPNYNSNSAGGGPFTIGANFEGDPYPRAIVSRFKIYNPDFNIGLSNAIDSNNHGYIGQQFPTNEYWAQRVSANGDAVLPNANSVANVIQDQGATYAAYLNPATAVYPLLALSITPSVAVYKMQQERFQNTRMRFLSQIVTSYTKPVYAAEGGAIGSTVIGSLYGTAVNTEASGDAQKITVNPGYIIGQAYTAANQGSITLQQTSCYSANIQKQVGLGRNEGVLPTQQSSLYIPGETFVNLQVSLGQLSMELDQIGTICMDSSQVLVQLQCNLPQNVLSAYLQPGLFYAGAATASTVTQPSSANAKTFLDYCIAGQRFNYTITDLCCRVEYQTYPEESYGIIRELLRQPRPYQSIRQQIDVLTTDSGIFTQRLSIGASSIVNAVAIFIVPYNNNTATYSGTTPNIQDCVVNYMGCQPPQDLRSTVLDSYYLNMQDLYLECDGRRYESMQIPLSNPALVTYLKTQAGLQSAMGKVLNVSFQEYLQNRFLYVIPVNVHNDREMQIHDQQIIITLSIDSAARTAISKMYNESTQTIANRFYVCSFAIVNQSLVDCSYVKV